MAAHTCNSNTKEAEEVEAGGSGSGTQGQLGLQMIIYFKKYQEKRAGAIAQ